MRINGRATRTIWLAADGWSVEVIDQTRLPHRVEVIRIASADDGGAGDQDDDRARRPADRRHRGLWPGHRAARGRRRRTAISTASIEMLAAQRPTAVNLRWALEEMRKVLAPLPPAERVAAAYAAAARICDDDVEVCRMIGVHGRPLLEAIAARKPGKTVNVLTHCNAGWLACVDWGTATAPIYQAHDAGIQVHVWVDETRPRNQGASLTAFELGQHGVPHTIIADNAGGHLMQHGEVDLCIVGTDRTTRERRRRQQDRHLPEGARRPRQRRPVLRRAADLDDRLDARRRPQDPDRGALAPTRC